MATVRIISLFFLALGAAWLCRVAVGLPTVSIYECAPGKATPAGGGDATSLCFVPPLNSVCVGGSDVNEWTRCYPVGGQGSVHNEVIIDGEFWCTAREPTTLFCLTR